MQDLVSGFHKFIAIRDLFGTQQEQLWPSVTLKSKSQTWRAKRIGWNIAQRNVITDSPGLLLLSYMDIDGWPLWTFPKFCSAWMALALYGISWRMPPSKGRISESTLIQIWAHARGFQRFGRFEKLHSFNFAQKISFQILLLTPQESGVSWEGDFFFYQARWLTLSLKKQQHVNMRPLCARLDKFTLDDSIMAQFDAEKAKCILIKAKRCVLL